MQVKKYYSQTIKEALVQIKSELGPDAIVLSTSREPKVPGKDQRFLVVAAVAEREMKKKQYTEEKLGKYSPLFQKKSALQQKQIIRQMVDSKEQQYRERNPTITTRPYFSIEDSDSKSEKSVTPETSVPPKNSIGPKVTRVQQAVKEVFSSNLAAQFLSKSGDVKSDSLSSAKSKSKLNPNFSDISSSSPIEKGSSSSPEVKAMFHRLIEGGLQHKTATVMVEKAVDASGGKITRGRLDSGVAQQILGMAKCVKVKEQQGYEYFLGPEGAGKTTSLLKVAANYLLQQSRRRMVIVTMDTEKVGAVDQLLIYKKILNIPVVAVKSAQDWKDKIEKLSENFDHILVDMPGLQIGEHSNIENQRRILESTDHLQNQKHWVVSATVPFEDQCLFRERCQEINSTDLIVNQVDQVRNHGFLLDLQIQWRLPFHSFGMNSDIIEGFEWATRERVLDLIFKLTKINGEKNGELLSA